ncbi:MAG TPA: MraY family glycosyltransferase [Prolixibacteraceae bacterium]|nr:MraY family glycosyltransferase [Prolixibacteraceae bacterium]
MKKLFDTPNERKLAVRRVVPTLGGLIIFIATIITFLIVNSDSSLEINSIIGISIIIAFVGIKDDLVGISAKSKLTIQLLTFTYTTIWLNIRILSFNGFLGIHELTYLTSIIFTILLSLMLLNSINLIDGIDGLFGSISLIISVCFGIIFLGSENQSYSFINFALAGSLIAFLFFNIFGKINKIFAGDTGTFFVGFILTISAIKSINIVIVPNSTIISLFLLPLFDTIRVFIIRIYLGRSPFNPDMNHIHHILLKKTSNHLITTLILVMYSLICFVTVSFIPIEPTFTIIILFIFFVLTAYYLNKSTLQKTVKKSKKESIQMPKLDLLELHYALGLKQNPFSNFSAEQEIDYLDDIYYSPKYFQPLFSDIKTGHTRFILGARGSGKTALLIKLKKQLDKNNVFSIIIDDYEGIPTENNSKFFLENTIRKIVTGYCFSIINSPILLKRLKKNEKEKLTFFIENFFDPITKKEFENYVNITSNYKSRNFWIRICNYLLKPFNSALSLGIEIGGDVVKKSIGLDTFNTTMVYKDYLKEFKEYIPNKTLFLESANYSAYKDILCDLSKIIKNSGFEQVVIMYDKIDEYKYLGGDITQITKFLNEILRDTNLLLNRDFGLVFSIWSELKSDLSKIGVRFDKISPIDVTWNNSELEDIINVRLNYSSIKPQNSIKFEDILADPRSSEDIISISDKSPRDLLKLIFTIYYEQADIDNRSSYLSILAIRKGILKFISDYEYYSILPQINNKDDILKSLSKILYCGKLTFKVSDISQDLNISIPTANGLIKNLIIHGIIIELNQTRGNAKIFEIIDPKIVWLIKNQINPWGR